MRSVIMNEDHFHKIPLSSLRSLFSSARNNTEIQNLDWLINFDWYQFKIYLPDMYTKDHIISIIQLEIGLGILIIAKLK